MAKTPLTYYGGKGILVKKLLKYVPPHHTYVEVFGGSAALLFAKPPSPVEVYNDIDSNVVNFFRVLRDPEKFEIFKRKVHFTPYSREEYEFCQRTFEDETLDDVERAYRFFVAIRQSLNGNPYAGWSYNIRIARRNMVAAASRWLGAIEGLQEAYERLMRVQIEHLDFRKVIPLYDTPNTFMYLDPPYIAETKKKKDAYTYEMSLEDHEEMVELLLKSQSMFMLSGYRHEVYEPLEEAGWKRIDFNVSCFAAVRGRNSGLVGEGAAKTKVPRTESIWLSPNCVERLQEKPENVGKEGILPL